MGGIWGIADGNRKCEIEGCDNMARIHNKINHVIKRGRYCEKHHRTKHPRTRISWRHKENFMNCFICKWNGPCDAHRIDIGGKYIKENTISICPNCHRLVHCGMYSFDGKNIIKNEGSWEEVRRKRGYKSVWKKL